MDSSCFLCGTTEDIFACPECGDVASCKQHFPIHRNNQMCYPFRVERREGRGNCLVAVRDIKPFQIILQDKPAIVGPFEDADLQCLECCRPMDEYVPCSQCTLPLCGPECENGPNHASECKYFKDSKPYPEVSELSVIYSTVAPLRMLDVKETKPELWSLVSRLEDHLQERRKTAQWSFLRENVFPFLEKYCSIGLPDCLERIIGIFRTNSVKWEDKVELKKRPVGHALCPVFSIICHSCVNNTRYTLERGEMTVRACVPILKGEEITAQYRGPNDGNILRRPDFNKHWMFDCDCIRCRDPTELNTHASTLRCFECKAPDLYPSDSDLGSDWACRSCGYTTSIISAREVTLRLEARLVSKSYSDSPESWEKFLGELERELHPNNFICMKTKRLILQIYGSRDGYTLEKMTSQQLKRKIDLCHNYIEVFSVLEPGFRVWKGRLLEELLGPTSVLLNKRMEAGEVGKVEYLLQYKNIIRMVKEAAKCRQFLERDATADSLMGEFYSQWIRPLTQQA